MQNRIATSVLTMRKYGFYILGLVLACLFAMPVFAMANTNPLPAYEAFPFSATVENSHTIHVHWQIAKDYYLYKQKLRFTFEPQVEADIQWPQGKIQQDSGRSPYEIYMGEVTIPITLHTQTQQVRLDVNYQGCSDKGFCYPPRQDSILIDLATQTVTTVSDVAKKAMAQAASQSQESHASLTSLLTNQNGVKEILASQNMGMLLLIFAGLGLLLAFTPCVMPMIPILTSIIIGHKQPVSTRKAFLLSSTYVLSSSLTYAAAGVLAAYMGSSLQAWLQQPWIIAIVSGLFVLLSLSLFGVYDLRLPNRWQNRITAISRKQEGGTYIGVFIMGMVSTLIVSPCVTAPLVGVLMYIAESGNMALGAGALFIMGIGMGIPLIVIGMTAGKWLPKRGPWMTGVQQIFGLLMLGMAMWLLSRVYSLSVIIVFCAVLFVAAAIYFGVYRTRFEGRHTLNRMMGTISGIAGVLLLITVSVPSLMNTTVNAFTTTQLSVVEANKFTIVHNMEELNKQLSLAQSSGKPVILDFYADWCESCVVMDKNVFSVPEVLNSLSHFVLLRADLSQNSAADADLLKNYDVIAPPTVLFFNDHGQEVNSHRIVGELNANEFLSRINTFITASCDTKVTC